MYTAREGQKEQVMKRGTAKNVNYQKYFKNMINISPQLIDEQKIHYRKNQC